MSGPDVLDERFDDLVAELRATRRAAPAELRARVRDLAAAAPAFEARQPLLERIHLRRVALVLVPVCLAAVVSAAMLQGLVASGRETAADPAADSVLASPPRGRGAESVQKAPPADAERSATLPPGQRLVDYRIQMRLRVANLEELSRATVRAMRTVRRLGGYVTSVRYSSPNVRDGGAVLVVRVPVSRMQGAILSFSELGTIVSQSVSLTDVQKLYTRQADAIGRLRTLIASAERRLRDEELSAEERLRLQQQLTGRRAELASLTRARQATGERGRLATARIALTTFRPAAKRVVPVPNEPSRFGRALDESGDVLAKELLWALYGLIVAAPLIVLALLGLAAARSHRRRSERRLLAQSL